MDVSVVMPLYNKAPHVAAAIKSCLMQSLSPREIIIIDDGSTDGSLEIVQSIADSRITVLTRSPPGPGGYAARNAGIKFASSEWVAFLDADDIWTSSHLADLDRARRCAGDEVGCLFSMFEIKRRGLDRAYPMSKKHIVSSQPLDLSAILRGWLEVRRCPFWTGASAFRRSLLVQSGLFPDGRARRGGDKFLWLLCVAREKAAFAPESSAEFHQDTVNRVTTSTNHLILPIILEAISGLLDDSRPSERRLLRRIANLEIEEYARHAGAKGMSAPFYFIKALYWPEGLLAAVKIMIVSAIAGIIAVASRRK